MHGGESSGAGVSVMENAGLMGVVLRATLKRVMDVCNIELCFESYANKSTHGKKRCVFLSLEMRLHQFCQ